MPNYEKMPVAIYQADKSNYREFSFSDTVEDIISQINRKTEEKWKPEKLAILEKGYQIKIFSSLHHKPPGWRKFIKPAVHSDSPLANCMNTIHRFICFIGVHEEIFLITGGMGTFHFIDQFIVQTFGLDILVRIIKKDSPVIKGIHDRGVTGIVLGQSRYFRDDQKIIDDDDFGKIYKEVKVELQQNILVKDFHFSKSSLKPIKSGCLARSSFQIKKAIKFEELLPLTKAFEEILDVKRKPNFVLNKVRLIDKKHNDELRKKLETEFIEKIFNDFINSQPFDIDFLNKDYKPYLEAIRYTLYVNRDDQVEFDEPPTFEEIVEEIGKLGSLMIESVEEFKHSVLYKDLTAIDENGTVVTNGSILQHLHGELAYDGKSYFLIDEQWYQVDSSFIQELNKECSAIVKECWDDKLINM